MIRRMRYKGWYIQSKKSTTGSYLAWASEKPSTNSITAPREVYFEYAETENAAIEKLKAEIKTLEPVYLSNDWLERFLRWISRR